MAKLTQREVGDLYAANKAKRERRNLLTTMERRAPAVVAAAEEEERIAAERLEAAFAEMVKRVAEIPAKGVGAPVVDRNSQSPRPRSSRDRPIAPGSM